MKRPLLVLVAGLARDRTIGKDGGIPWHYPEDWRNFRKVTQGSALVMGRRTMESIGRALPGRLTVVVSRSPAAVQSRWPEVRAAPSLDAAIRVAADAGEDRVSISGGAEIYRLALPMAAELWLTFLPEDGGGDTFFPEWDDGSWTEASRETLERVEMVRYRRSAAGD